MTAPLGPGLTAIAIGLTCFVILFVIIGGLLVIGLCKRAKGNKTEQMIEDVSK